MTGIRRTWSRREFLSAAGIYGGAAALMTILPELGDARASGGAPRRLLLVSSGNGSVINQWRPRDASGNDLPSGSSLSPLTSKILEPLDHLRDKLVLIDGLDMGAAYNDDLSDAHISNNPAYDTVTGHAAATILWTGRNGKGLYWSAPNGEGEFPDGPSVDQTIADAIGKSTAFGSLQLGNHKPQYRDSGIHSYDLAGNPLPPLYLPDAVFAKVFDGAESNEAELAHDKERHRKSFGLLRGELGRLAQELPADDRIRLEGHLSHLDALEQRLNAMAACEIGTPPAQSLGFQDSLEAMHRIIQQAFACDRTRVISYTLVPEVNAFTTQQLSFLPGWNSAVYGDDHALSHESYFGQAAADVMTEWCRWQMTQLAALLDLLAAVDEGVGETMLDNTVVVWGTGMSHGGTHLSRATPAIIATGANGGFQTNRYLRFGNYDPDDLGRNAQGNKYSSAFECAANNHLLVSLCHAFGLGEVTTFGDARFSGPLAGLELS